MKIVLPQPTISLSTSLDQALSKRRSCREFSTAELERIVEGDARDRLGDAALDEQPWVQQAALILVLTADFESMQAHFNEQPPRGKRGERYIYLESGAIAQNIGLQATALGLGAVIVVDFDDAAVIAALQLPHGSRPTTLICIGVGEPVTG